MCRCFLKTRDESAIDVDQLLEHPYRPDPEATLAVQRTIHHELFFGLRVPGYPKHLVFLTLIVPIPPW
jgi:hypothetical protein